MKEDQTSSPCGTSPCRDLVKDISAAWATQQENGFQAVKELMNVHHTTVKASIADVKMTIKEQGDIIHPQLRNLDGRLKVLEATIITEDKVKTAIAENENIIWLGRSRSRTAKVLITVAAGVILSMPVWLKKALVMLGVIK